MRKIVASLTLCSVVSLCGCGGGETTDPKTLKPLTAADIAEINARDAQIEDEENEKRVEAPKVAKSKSKSRSRAADDGLGER